MVGSTMTIIFNVHGWVKKYTRKHYVFRVYFDINEVYKKLL